MIRDNGLGESITEEPLRKDGDELNSFRQGEDGGQPTRRRSSAMEEDECYPKTQQDELNEILESFYAMVSDDDIREYQRYVESVSDRKIAEGAVQPISKAPDFELVDQDEDIVRLSELLQDGPVVCVFYRGSWCPHCNAVIMNLQRVLEKIKDKGASLVAISPMLPDGTHYLATKRSLNFPVCSDVGNVVARKFRLTFEILPDLRETFLKWGDDIPLHNGDDSWEIPLPATYIIDTNGDVVWSFVDNDPGVRAEPEDILAAIPQRDDFSAKLKSDEFSADMKSDSDSLEFERCKGTCKGKNFFNRRHLSSTFKKNVKKVFGKKKQPPQEFIPGYLLRS